MLWWLTGLSSEPTPLLRRVRIAVFCVSFRGPLLKKARPLRVVQ
jgi:hypothetical protein